MINIVFKNLQSSDLIRQTIEQQLNDVFAKFPRLSNVKASVIIDMYNSQFKKGPDLYGIKLKLNSQKIRNLFVEKKASNIYFATAELRDSLVEILARKLTKLRSKSFKKSRKLKKGQPLPQTDYE
jgi:ribosome-associated translation inhibitor RaiA